MIDFHGVYERHAADLLRFSLYLSGNRAIAEDLVADAFVRMWTASGEIRTDTVKGYLLAIVRNLYLTRRRRAARDVPLDDGELLRDVAQLIDVQLEHREELARVRSILATLSEVDRSALLLRALHDLPYSDIARILAISVTSAKVKVHRAAHPPGRGAHSRKGHFMNITRDVIIDVLPLYESGDASADTRALVEQFLLSDPEFATLVKAAARSRTTAPSRVPTGDTESIALMRTRAALRRRSWTLALAIALTLLPLAFVFDGGRITFLLWRDEPGSRLLLLGAAACWWVYFRQSGRLRPAGW